MYFTANQEIVTSCEPWPWSIDRFVVAIVICSVDDNTTVVPVSGEFSHLLWHFVTHRAEMNAEDDVLSIYLRQIEDSVLCNTPWEEVGSTSERHYSRRKCN